MPCTTHLARMDPRIVHNDPYRWLEQSSPATIAWLSAQADHTAAYYERAAARVAYWKAALYEHYNTSTVLQEAKLQGSYSVALIDRGLNQPNEIVLKEGDREVKVLFSSHDVSRDGSIGLTRFSVDPQGKYLLVPIVHSGSLDSGDLYIVSIESGKLVTRLEKISDYGVTWINPHEFIYGRYLNIDYARYVHRVGGDTSKDRRYESEDDESNSPDRRIVIRRFDNKTALRFVDDSAEEILDIQLQSILAVTPRALYAKMNGRDGWPEIVRISMSRSASGGLKLGRYQSLSVRHGNSGRVFFNQERTLISFSLGAKRWAVVLDKIGEVDQTIELPNHSSLIGCEFLESNQLKLSFTSPVVKYESFVFDLSKQSFVDSVASIEKKMMTDSAGRRYVTKYVTVTSADGKKLPVRLVHRRDLDLDGNRPALAEGYGGFGAAGYMDPQFRFEIAKFLSDGGVYAAPALRGGNELGPQWHADATYRSGDKMNTFEDMAATLRMLALDGYSNPQKIAIEGWSNGGYLVGAMATLFGSLFKLGIAGNGVQDQLRKQILDPRFGGWAYEYGDPEADTDAFARLAKISPVTVALQRRRYPSLLVIAGEDDSRVNRAHSLKFVAALQNSRTGRNPILLLAVPKSGHWVTHGALQDMRAYRTQVQKWAAIYHELGIEPMP